MKPLPLFTAVVHVCSNQQAVEQTDLALANGAGGVFLIDHHVSHKTALQHTYREVRRKFPQAWIGLNFLSIGSHNAAASLPVDADALWLDDLDRLDATAIAPGRTWRIFGGASFKGQGRDEQAMWKSEAATVASRLGLEDVVTTSGPATGQAAPPEKVLSMKQVLGSRLLGLASGVTIENVDSYRLHVNCFLIASGIGKSFHEFDPVKVREIADRLA